VNKKKQQLREVIADTARAVFIAHSYDPEVRWQIEALLGKLDGTLSDEQVLEELKMLRGRQGDQQVGPPSRRCEPPC
jgi:hypothetical protein